MTGRRTSRAQPPSSWLVAFSGAAVALMHAVPIGIVQFADYASDLGVITTFATSSKTALEDAMRSDPELFLNLTVDLNYVNTNNSIPPIYPPLDLETATELAASINGSTAALLEAYIADEYSFRIGLGCVTASVGVVWAVALVAYLYVFFALCREAYKRGLKHACNELRALIFEKNEDELLGRLLAWVSISALLAPFNLHTLYLATMVATARARLSVLETGGGGSPELWQAYDAAQEATNIAYRRGDPEEIRRAIQVGPARRLHPLLQCHHLPSFLASQAAKKASDELREAAGMAEYFDALKKAGLLTVLFVLCKAVETALEVPHRNPHRAQVGGRLQHMRTPALAGAPALGTDGVGPL